MKKKNSCSLCKQQGHNKSSCAQNKNKTKRKVMTIESRKKIFEEKYPGISERLPHESNSELARAYGISREYVRQLRKVVGIEKELKNPDVTEISQYLGVLSDAEIERRFPQFSSARVGYFRRVHGIEPAPKPDRFEALRAHVERLGKISDKKLSKELNVATSLVFDFRKSLGIEPVKKSPRSPGFKKMDRDKIMELLKQGKSDSEIATELGSTRLSVQLIRRQLGFYRREKRRKK